MDNIDKRTKTSHRPLTFEQVAELRELFVFFAEKPVEPKPEGTITHDRTTDTTRQPQSIASHRFLSCVLFRILMIEKKGTPPKTVNGVLVIGGGPGVIANGAVPNQFFAAGNGNGNGSGKTANNKQSTPPDASNAAGSNGSNGSNGGAAAVGVGVGVGGAAGIGGAPPQLAAVAAPADGPSGPGDETAEAAAGGDVKAPPAAAAGAADTKHSTPPNGSIAVTVLPVTPADGTSAVPVTPQLVAATTNTDTKHAAGGGGGVPSLALTGGDATATAAAAAAGADPKTKRSARAAAAATARRQQQQMFRSDLRITATSIHAILKAMGLEYPIAKCKEIFTKHKLDPV